MWTSVLPIIALACLSSAHFILHYPPSAGFDDKLEIDSPCGSFTPMVNSSSPDVQVDRFAVMIQNVHPVGEWSFRATIDTTAPYNFTEIVPIVMSTGIGDFCLDSMKAPSDWAGKPGIIQVVDNSPDGILYQVWNSTTLSDCFLLNVTQCAPVNFVTGSNNTAGPACTNATSFKATWTNPESFPGENGGSSAGQTTMSMSNNGAGSASATAGAASSSSSGGAAAVITSVRSLVGGLGLLAAGFCF